MPTPHYPPKKEGPFLPGLKARRILGRFGEQDRYMLVFTLGPVQPFIAQARKTRDFWTGSLLFSKIMEAAMRDIDVQGTFVYPQKRTVEKLPDIPNKYIALFPDLVQAQKAARQSQKQIAAYWRYVCNTVWKEIVAKAEDDETLKIWRRQTGIDPKDPKYIRLDALFDVYWAIGERQQDQKYGDWLKKTEELLAARKQLRDFQPQEEPGEKSSISGEREILHAKGIHPEEVQNFWKRVAVKADSPKDIDQEGKERLDAIDTIKRFAMKAGAISQEPFPSTSSIATASFVERLLQVAPDLTPSVLRQWRQVTRENTNLINKSSEATADIPYLKQLADDPRYAEQLWILRRDGDLYFPETFVAQRLEKTYNIQAFASKGLAQRGSSALSDLLQATHVLKITRPTPYYGVVQMDGDKMGILLNNVKDQEEHSAISQALSFFARETAVDLVEKRYPARLVYAGGDDVLAFAPLARDTAEADQPHQILQLVEQLQTAYRQGVIAALPEPREEKRVENITASTGIVITHHFTPLSYVLRLAREAEESAKKHYGRNALVVTLVRRSGEQTRVGCHWYYPGLEDLGQPVKLFSFFYQLFKDDVLSPKCIYALLEEAPALVKLGSQETVEAEPGASAMRSEIKRVLKRQRDPAQQERFPDQTVDAYAGYLTRLAAAMDADKYPRQEEGESKSAELHSHSRRYGLVEVLGWLLVMVFLAKEQE